MICPTKLSQINNSHSSTSCGLGSACFSLCCQGSTRTCLVFQDSMCYNSWQHRMASTATCWLEGHLNLDATLPLGTSKAVVVQLRPTAHGPPIDDLTRASHASRHLMAFDASRHLHNHFEPQNYASTRTPGAPFTRS